MKLYEQTCKNLLVKSKLPGADWVINPYVGCTHRCQYCYAIFMRRFYQYEEKWGDFLAVKSGPLRGVDKVRDNQVVLIGSVTDAYQPIEKQTRCTRMILQQLADCRGTVEILTKSKLILRDMELLQQFSKIRVGISLNTLDDSFRRTMEPGASTVEERLQTLRTLKENGIETYLFVSPIFPEITNLQEIVEATRKWVDTYYFENLNLRGDYKEKILEYIQEAFPEYQGIYQQIYRENSMVYWENCKHKIENLAVLYNVRAKEYFYHSKIRKQ